MTKWLWLYPSDTGTYFKRTDPNTGKSYKVHFTGHDDGQGEERQPFIFQAAMNTEIEIDDLIIEILSAIWDADLLDAFAPYKWMKIKLSDTFWRKTIRDIMKTAKKWDWTREFPILSLYIKDRDDQ